MHSGSEGTDSLRKESRQKLSDLYCKINRKSPFQKAAKGCFENWMRSCPKWNNWLCIPPMCWFLQVLKVFQLEIGNSGKKFVVFRFSTYCDRNLQLSMKFFYQTIWKMSKHNEMKSFMKVWSYFCTPLHYVLDL